MRKYKAMIISALVTLGISSYPISAHAIDNFENKLVGSENSYLRRDVWGSSYWGSSNIREWLNSTDSVVKYTNLPPSSQKLGNTAYDMEPGFLTTFTKSEQEGIAVTNHRVHVNFHDANTGGKHGGGLQRPPAHVDNQSLLFQLPNIEREKMDYFYRNEKDKVFLLNIWEVYDYIQKRGLPLTKSISKSAKNKNSYFNDTIPWLTSTGYAEQASDNVSTVGWEDSATRISRAQEAKGVVPAIHLKPEYRLSNNMLAKDMKIGDEVKFGTYLGEELVWMVVNKSEDNYPLLITKEVIDIKPYDTPGDDSYLYSNYVRFEKGDVDITNEPFQMREEESDITPPVFEVLNREELNKRQNKQFVLKVKVQDSESGLDYVQLPNGNRIKTGEFEYTFAENKEYNFVSKDKAGNYRYSVVPIGNVNIPSKVEIKASTEGWTNKDVSVDISSTNDVGYEGTYKQDTRDSWLPMWQNFTTYKDKRVKITGNVEFINAKREPVNETIGVGFSYIYMGNVGSEYTLRRTWTRANNFKLIDLKGKGKFHFEEIFKIPDNYYKDLQPWTQIDVPHIDHDFTVEYSDLKYELLDNDDFQVDKITLPNGREVHQNAYRDTLSEEGTYVYKVLDNRGKETEKTVKVLIDKDNPVLNIEGIPNTFTNKEIELKLKSSDSKSGVSRIELPNSSQTNQEEISYKIKANGSYTFKVYDKAGNVTVKTMQINQIDITPPEVSTNVSISQNKKEGFIDVKATDSQSGVSEIVLPNGTKQRESSVQFKVDQNGVYPFVVFDNAGNRKEVNVKVNGLEIPVSSGIQKVEYTLEGAINRGWTLYKEPFMIMNEGITTVKSRVYDKAGNISETKTRVVKIDKTKPNQNQIKIELTE
ncbi:OmpL47-type beta-barrel domain-containing protein [Bacillus cereus group sp. BfR-BA-01317]|uniref:OmpL47-type beta-barrel domain-containing protein n=1 Tax=Bacillus cereus group sp. BfR-BA-01317 TaxID=2920294 RepID=UPI001F5AC164|nr:DUF6273 domain-containing protein [Bacillus cereus group sp. BfR-BA-01317]